jgi:hypothetical protein
MDTVALPDQVIDSVGKVLHQIAIDIDFRTKVFILPDLDPVFF